MRDEVKQFMRQCERLISLALQTRELSEEECDVISYYAKELHEKTHPFCSRGNPAHTRPSVPSN